MHNIISLAVALSGRFKLGLFMLADVLDAVAIEDICLSAVIFPLGNSWLLQKQGQDQLRFLQ